ncbi:hypothetical protein JKP88DRAFT_160272 [Tribonema minus]|uniref:Metal-dependent HD superfamily phosphohydrolase n=1 Tax=Tribonema minus TaxID=303371 RepID=A0A835ZF01_9STRA|nr:hypothetical protein JKP88DRAFT_160272 [Tribonema minus]
MLGARERNRLAWQQLMSQLGVPQETGWQWWQTVDTHYSEGPRSYHTHEHIADMLQQLTAMQPPPCKPALLTLAIFFHDVIYDPMSGTNEEDSAALYTTFAAAITQEASDAQLVSDYIIATKTHSSSPATADSNLAALLDLDLAVLGRPREGYQQYASQIRREYSFVPAAEYCSKRAAVLRQLAAAPALYRTQHFATTHEARARENLAAEIAQLERGDIPQ